MPIQFQCQKCSKVLKVKDEHAGKAAKCPGCGQALGIPAPREPGPPKASAPVPAEQKPQTVACFLCEKPVRKNEAVERGDEFYCKECHGSLGAAVHREPAEEPEAGSPARNGAETTSSAATSTSAPRSGAGDLAGLRDAMAAANKSALRPVRWAFLFALIPLAWYTFCGTEPELDPNEVSRAFHEKLAARLTSNPALKESLDGIGQEQVSLDRLILWAQAFEDPEFTELLQSFQEDWQGANQEQRAALVDLLGGTFMKHYSGLLPPPLLAEDSWGHWGLGLLSAVAFLLYFCLAYPRGNARPSHLLAVGVFTGTLGILFLLAVQWLSSVAARIRMRGRGLIMLIWLILIAIAFSYAAADDPTNGFFLSCVGFTLGVGLMEELTKLLPVIWHYRADATLSWGGACVWGLVSGAGFGVAEGIMYSSRYYNGESTLGIYIVRFVSCVAIHAAWAGAAAILMFRRRDWLKGDMDKWDWARAVFPAMWVPMVLHGLYDTFLKTDMAPWALATGVASFGYFVFLQEKEARAQAGEAMALMGIAK